MEIILEKIIQECKDRGIHVYEEEPLLYNVNGLSKDGKADLYICETDNVVVFENKYGEKEHVLSFRDFVNVAHFWCKKYKDWTAFSIKEAGWHLVFKEYVGGKDFYANALAEDLPF